MRVTAQDFIRIYFATPVNIRRDCVWFMRKKTFDQVHEDVYPVRLSNQLMGRPIQIDHKMTEGKIRFVPEENK